MCVRVVCGGLGESRVRARVKGEHCQTGPVAAGVRPLSGGGGGDDVAGAGEGGEKIWYIWCGGRSVGGSLDPVHLAGGALGGRKEGEDGPRWAWRWRRACERTTGGVEVDGVGV